jgi:maltose alpha-D-glucosyltransferase/alpha-amylase
MFPGVEDDVWRFDDEAGLYALHRFYGFEPDLASANDEVRRELADVVRFWCRIGVGGIRLDAVPSLVAKARLAGLGDGQVVLRELAGAASEAGDPFLLGEADVEPEQFASYVDDGRGLDFVLNFYLANYLFLALSRGEAAPLRSALDRLPRLEHGGFANFLRNHDELDLGQLTEQQRRQVFKCFGPEKDMQLYERGIRRRLAPMLNGDRRLIELAYSLVFTLPGTPVLRYGDEIGMGDDLGLPERNCARTPMQWSAEPHGGFTTAEKPVVPVIGDGPFGYQHVNAAEQRRDPKSLLNWTERIVRMRKEVPEVGWGEFEILSVRDPAVLGIRYDWRNNSVLFLHNLSDTPREVVFSSGRPRSEGRVLVNLLSDNHSRAAADGRHRLLLEAYGYRWFRVGGLDYLLKRSEIETPPRG